MLFNFLKISYVPLQGCELPSLRIEISAPELKIPCYKSFYKMLK